MRTRQLFQYKAVHHHRGTKLLCQTRQTELSSS